MQDLSLFFQAEATDDDLFPFSSLMATQEAASQEDLFDPEKDYEVPADKGQNAFRRRAFSRKQSTTQDTLRPRKLHLRRSLRRMEML